MGKRDFVDRIDSIDVVGEFNDYCIHLSVCLFIDTKV